MLAHFEDGHNCEMVASFLSGLCELSREMNTVVNGMRFPRPSGFRIRVVSGFVHQMNLGGNETDYVGYPVNLAFKLLNANPDELLICHESVKDVLGNGKYPIKFEKVAPTPTSIDGVDSDDLAAIWSFKCTKSS